MRMETRFGPSEVQMVCDNDHQFSNRMNLKNQKGNACNLTITFYNINIKVPLSLQYRLLTFCANKRTFDVQAIYLIKVSSNSVKDTGRDSKSSSNTEVK